MEEEMIQVSAERVQIHSMDNLGTKVGTVHIDGHTMNIDIFHENCGVTITTFDCSCGFSSAEQTGYGCW